MFFSSAMNPTHLYRKPPSISDCFSDIAWYVQKHAIMIIMFLCVYNQHKTKSQTWFLRSRFNLRSAQIVGNGLYMYKTNWVSFDFNVSYSSCWGYSLINTLKSKLKHRLFTSYVYSVFVCVSQALGKAAGCLLRRWKEQESERAARCVIYICLYM